MRKAGADWNDAGPDLLRPRDNARSRLRANIDVLDTSLFYRKHLGEEWTPWRGPFRKFGITEAFDDWHLMGNRFQVSHRPDVDGLITEVRHVSVPYLEISRCSPGTSIAWSLGRSQFGGGLLFGGGYVFKHSGDFWSDHAYGTAVDATDEAKGRDNEKHFRWYVRMAQAGLISYDYIIGSIDGRVHSAQAPDFEIEPGGGDSSHEWHCHISHIDHDGRRPSRPGGWT